MLIVLVMHGLKKRSLEQAAEDPLQLRISDYWNIVHDIEQLQYKNEKLSMLVRVISLLSRAVR